jgi:hypothetical protein
MRQRVLGDVEVVADEVAFRQAALRKKDLARVRNTDVVAAYPHRVSLAAGSGSRFLQQIESRNRLSGAQVLPICGIGKK